MNDLTDKEQIELIKKWWRQYGLVVSIAIVIGLAIGFGWRYWHKHRIVKAEEASLIYSEMQNAAAENKFDVAQGLATRLINEYRNTPYASLGALLWARDAVLQNNLELAREKLDWVIKNGKMVSLKQIARVRAARILSVQKKYQTALNILKAIDDPAYQPLIDTVKGDIYNAQGKKALAKKSYQAAKNGFETSGIVDPFLNMKIAQ